MHSTGKAADVHPVNIGVVELYKLAEEIPDLLNGGIGVSLEDGYVHCDIRGSKARWAYKGHVDHACSDPLSYLGVANG